MPPPKSFKRAVWPGQLVAGSDIESLANSLSLDLTASPNFECAASEINGAVQTFCTLLQRTDGPGRYADWFGRVAAHAGELIDELISDEGSNQHAEAMTAFLVYPKECAAADFDAADLDAMVAWLQAMTRAAVSAQSAAKLEKDSGGKPHPETKPLAAGLNRAFDALMRVPISGHSTATNGDIGGPFIDFSVAVLRLLANRLEAGDSAGLDASVEKMRDIAGSPNRIKRLRLLGRKVQKCSPMAEQSNT